MKNLFHNALVIANSFPGPRQPLTDEQKKAIFAKTKYGRGGGGSVADGSIYTSTDSGANWVARTNAPLKRWYSVASSADGTKLVAVTYDGHIYISADSGATWEPRGSSTFWSSVASSVDGSKLVALDSGSLFSSGGIHTSTDSGTTWVQQTNAPAKIWRSVASSADGTKLVAVESAGGVYTSTDSGTNWTLRTGGYIGLPGWRAVASSADGNKLVAGEYDSIYTSAGGWFTPALTPDTTYHYRLVATNRAGIRFGANMTFTTTVTPSPDFRLVLNIPLAEGTFLLTFTNVTGASFTVLGTTNLLVPLTNWIALGPLVEDPSGTYTFTDPQVTNSPQLFYRVTSP